MVICRFSNIFGVLYIWTHRGKRRREHRRAVLAVVAVVVAVAVAAVVVAVVAAVTVVTAAARGCEVTPPPTPPPHACVCASAFVKVCLDLYFLGPYPGYCFCSYIFGDHILNIVFC